MPSPQFDPASQAPQPRPLQAPVQARTPSRWLPILGAGLGLLGLIAGVSAWMRPVPSGVAAPVYSDQQVADAKKAVCEAYAKGMRSIQGAGTKKPDNPADTLPGSVLNMRLAEIAVGNSFFHSTQANPAAPADLLDLTNQLGTVYQDIALTQLADGSKFQVDPIATKADDLIPKIEQKCR
jgi:hypothetical protein